MAATVWDAALHLQSTLESAWRQRPPCEACGKAGKSLQGQFGPLVKHVELHPKQKHIELVGLTPEGRGFVHTWVQNHPETKGYELKLGVVQS